jgi:hypothetical protein
MLPVLQTQRALSGILCFLARNWLICAALLAGLALRLVTMLGFPPAIWFAGDSISYVTSALNGSPGISRESGYSVLLMALHPMHSFAVVTGFQHLLGLAMGMMIYALLRHRGLARWGAALAALPILLDAYQIQLEQEVLPDVLFTFLVVAAVTLYGWWRDDTRPPWASAAGAALLGAAAACWPVGLPLLVLALAVAVIRRAGWRSVTAAVLAGAVPLAMYLAWFDAHHHRIAFNSSSGVFLWSRTMTFADCAVIRPPADERPLCPDKAIGDRQAASLWIWQKHTPIANMTPKFSVRTNTLAGDFAKRAILAQPGGYLRAVLDGFALSFTWNRAPHPNKLMSERYQFTLATRDWDHGAKRTAAIVRVQRGYTGGHLAFTSAVRPFSTFMIGYQRGMYLRGTMTGVLLLLGLAGIARWLRASGWRRRRDWGGPALLPWLAGLAVLLVPVMTADFSLRYVVPAVPVITLAAAMAFLRPAPRRAPSPVPPWPAGGSLAGQEQPASTGSLPARA